MSYSLEFQSLLQHPQSKSHYIGLGNPNARILIVGKECAYDVTEKGCKNEFYENEFLKNYDKWQKLDSSRSLEDVHNWVENDKLDWDIFDPLAPYKGQYFAFGKRKGATSRTWYNYQKLVNIIRDLGRSDLSKNTSRIDFYKDCFITELNEHCRKSNTKLSAEEKKNTKRSIEQRFDWMKATNSFWSSFETVILACGPYADALRIDADLRHSIFGDANVISTIPTADGKVIKIPQLSLFISENLLQEIAKQVK